MRSRRAGALAGAVTLVAGLFLAPAARAHADLLFSDPADGAVLTAAPEQVDLTFSDPIDAESVIVTVSDDTGFEVRVVTVHVDDGDVIFSWPAGMSGREYGIDFDVISLDGHPVSGAVHLTIEPAVLAAPSTTAPSATAADASASGEPNEESSQQSYVPAVLVGLAVGVAFGVGYAVISRARKRANPHQVTP